MTKINKLLAAVLTCLLLACPAWAANQVVLPAKVNVKAGRLVKLVAVSDGTRIKWINGSPEAADLIPSEGGTWAIFAASAPGVYHVYAYTAKGDEPSEAAECVVTATDPGPGPAPTPTPPGPTPPNPTPGPVPPAPTPVPPADPLLAALQAAYGAEPAADKAAQKAQLASLYRQGAAAVKTNATLTTWGGLFDAVTQVAKLTGVFGTLPGVQKAVQAELVARFPANPNAALDQAGKDLAAATFGRIAGLLEQVK